MHDILPKGDIQILSILYYIVDSEGGRLKILLTLSWIQITLCLLCHREWVLYTAICID